MKFAAFLQLNEGLSDDLDKAVKQLLPHLKALDYKSTEEKVLDAVQLLRDGLESGKIYNVDYNTAKQDLSRALSLIWDAQYNHKVENHDGNTNRWVSEKIGHDFYYTNVQLNTLAKAKRYLDKVDRQQLVADHGESAGKIIDGFRDMLEAGLVFNEAVKQLKPKIVMGRKPAQNADPNAFVSKLGSVESQQLIHDSLLKSVEAQLDSYEKNIKAWLQGQLDQIENAGEYEYPTHRQRDPQTIFLVQRCFEFKHEYINGKERGARYSNLKLNETGKHFPAKEAKQMRDFIQTRFLNKAIKKLSDIVDKKGNLEKIEELPRRPVHVSRGSATVECAFKFSFADGSHFSVINKAVSKFSYTGKPFDQYPTTFHDVVFPDGSKLRIPSEEKMVKVFTTGKNE